MLDPLPLFDLPSSRTARDAGMQAAESNSPDWVALALIEMREFARDTAVLRDYPQGFTMTNIRQWLVPLLGQPHHPNVFGAFAMKCVRAGLIADTGKISRTGAHCRKQTVYRWAI